MKNNMKFSLLIFLMPLLATPPGWSVTPSDYQLTASITAQVNVDYEPAGSANDLLGAFVDGVCRGVSSPVYIMDSWMYFLTVYSNLDGETVTFQTYLADRDTVITTLETISFTANGVYGSPFNPYQLNAIIDFDNVPVVSGIPDQEIDQGGSFSPFDLDDYLTELDGDAVIWSYSGNLELSVTIDADNVVTITPPSSDWTGNETITFTVTDDTEAANSSSQSVTFTVVPVDHPPVLGDIPDQVIGLLGNFQTLSLADYLTESDGDAIMWDHVVNPVFQGDAPPSWNVNVNDFELSMTLTAQVKHRGADVEADGFMLAAFSGDEVRGVTSGQYLDGLNTYLFFLSVYSNTNGEAIEFKLWNPETEEELPVYQTYAFEANGVFGTPFEPVILQAGNILVSISTDGMADITIVDEMWTGTEVVTYIAKDAGTDMGYSDSTQVSYTILPDHSPVVADIPHQTIEAGGVFTPFDLDDYLTEVDGDDVVWSASGNVNLVVDIDWSNGVTITPVTSDWSGSEEITFTVTDQTAQALSASTSAVFTVLPVDHPPDVGNIPDQSIGIGESFAPIHLDDYLTELDGDQVGWSYSFVAPAQPDEVPVWNVNPGDFEMTMTLTAVVTSRGEMTMNSGDMLAAFAGDECRGVTTPVEAVGQMMYFLTIYANGNGEEISFKFYDAGDEVIVPVDEKFTFFANEVNGDLFSPVQLNAGFLLITLDADNVATINLVDESWSGSEVAIFTATDLNTTNGHSDFDMVTFTYTNYLDLPPFVNTIPDQTINEGENFTPFDLDDYVVELDGDSLVWNFSGNAELQVTMDADHVVTVTPPDANWTGSEEIVFVATDYTDLQLSGATQTVFTVLAVNDPPEPVSVLPDVDVAYGDSLLVDVNVFTDVDGDPITISAYSDDENVADVTVIGNSALIRGNWMGTANITVTADDGNGGTGQVQFQVTVFCDGIIDCDGWCNGSAFVDDCGVCSEGTTGHTANSDMDCNGDCPEGTPGWDGALGGTAYPDDCGVCSGGNTGHTANSDMDCNGDCPEGTPGWDGALGGTAYPDDCGVCSGGNTVHTANSDMDCNGDCSEGTPAWDGALGGTAFPDDCGVCSGGNTGHTANSDMDCNGDCPEGTPAWDGALGGTAYPDDCGVCSGGNSVHTANSDMDCMGDCPEGTPAWDGALGGTAYLDDCGVCSGGNSVHTANSDMDCNGDCYGDAFFDDCGVCSGGNSGHEPESDRDCNGDCFGVAYLDNCGVCSEGNTGVTADEDMDCNGDCFGSAYFDDCGICSEGNTGYTANSVMDCNGDCPEGTPGWDGALGGTAYPDECGVCSEGNTGHEVNSDMDCNGDCPEGTPAWDGALGGTAFPDECGVCSEGNSGHEVNSDMDCFGVCYGTALTVNDTCQIQGDINDDDLINVADIVEMVNLILSGETPTPFQLIVSDLYYDGELNIFDVIALVDMILNPAGLLSSEPLYSAGLSVGVQGVTAQSDGSVAAIELDIAGNFEIIPMNEGIQVFNSERKVIVLSVTGERLTGSNLFSYRGDLTIHRAVAYSWDSNLVDMEITYLPESYTLSDAYPNPFNPVTTVVYGLPVESHVEVLVYDMLGREVTQLVNGVMSTGYHSVQWDASNLASGVYMVRLTAGDYTAVQKVSLLK